MDLTKITGLWKHKDKNGRTYLSGNLTPVAGIMIMKNDFKGENGNGPDYWFYVRQNQKKKVPSTGEQDDFEEDGGKEEVPF